MPWYTTSSGKRVYSEKEVPDNELDSFLDEIEPAAPLTVGKPQEQSFMGKAWDVANKPLVAPEAFKPNQPFNRTLPTDKSGFYEKYVEPFAQGVLEEGIPNTLSSLTSPINLAATALGGVEFGAVKAGLTGPARLAGIANKVIGAPVAAHGGLEVASGIQERDPSRALMGIAELAGGAAAMKAPLPERVNPRVTSQIAPTPDFTPIEPDFQLDPSISGVKLKRPTSKFVGGLRDQGFESAGVDPNTGLPVMRRSSQVPEIDPRISGLPPLEEQRLSGITDELGNELGGYASGPTREGELAAPDNPFAEDPIQARARIEAAREAARSEVDRDILGQQSLQGIDELLPSRVYDDKLSIRHRQSREIIQQLQEEAKTDPRIAEILEAEDNAHSLQQEIERRRGFYNLKGGPDDIAMARTKQGGVKIGADVESLGKILGRSLYQGNISTIATKELLQNSIDAIRPLGDKGKISVKFNQSPQGERGLPSLEVTDNGPGLTRQEIESVFTDLGSSGKRSDVSAIGGFGLAKAAPLLGGEHVVVSTVARNPKTGKLMAVEFDGTPDELLKGVELDEIEVPEGTPTGTTVRVSVPKDSPFWEARDMVTNIGQFSDFPGQVEFGSSYGGEAPAMRPLERAASKEGKLVASLENPSGNTNLIIPKGVKPRETSSIEVIYSNKGMYQGKDTIWINGKEELPPKIIVDIDAKVPEGHPDYPFTANREALRGSVKELVDKYIQEEIVNPAQKKRVKGIDELYQNMQSFRTPQGREIFVHDTGGKFTPEELNQIMSEPFMQELGTDLGNLVDETILVMVDEPEWVQSLDRIGFIFDDKLRGINIPNPSGKGKFAVMVNPLQLMQQSADQAAAGFVHTTLHEIAHLGARNHNEPFTIGLANVYERFGALRAIDAQRKFLDTVTNDGRTYNPEVQEVLQRYTESRRRTVAKEDILTGTGVSSKVREEGQGGISSDTRPGRTRTTRVALNSSDPKVIERLRAEGYRPTGRLTPDNKPIWQIVEEPSSPSKTEKPSRLKEAYNLSRGLTASFDISAPMRQGLPLIGTAGWFKAWMPMLRSYESEGAFNNVMQKIESRPMFKPSVDQVFRGGRWVSKETPSFAEQAGLAMTDLSNFSNREEVLMSQLAERLPFKIGSTVRRGNRAYTAFLNNLRADTFESLVKNAGLENDLVGAKAIAEFVNDATGRGKLEYGVGISPTRGRKLNLEQHSKLFTDVLFSPRLFASRMRMLNPATYLMASPVARKEYMKSALRVATTWMTVAGLGKIAGAQVSLDPNNADFGKIRVGNTRLDPAGGFQQYLVALSRLVTGKTTSSTSGKEYTLGEGYKAPTRKSTIEDFASNKLHPVLKFAYDLLDASEYKPFHMGDRIAQMFVPLVIQDITELAREDPSLLPLAGLTSIGMGTQTYEKGKPESVVIPEEYDMTFTGGPLSHSN